MQELPLALTFDDVLLVPRRSRIRSRADVSTRTLLTRRIALEIPVVSANMDTVTTAPMAIALAQLGGIGVIHRFLSVEDEVAEVTRVKRFRTRVISDPHTIAPDASVAQARAEAERLGVSGLLVVDGDGRLVGILTTRDVRAGGGGDPVADHMTPRERLVTGPPGIAEGDALALLHHHRIEKLPLADDAGRVAGMVTLRDLEQEARYPQATRDAEGRLRVAAAIGVRGGYLERAEALLEADADALVLDIAHGHADSALEAVRELKRRFQEAEVIAGNVATADAVHDLVAAGADAVKVGIGPGFACTTRLVAGVGVPQLSAVLACAAAARETGVPLIADGGIRRPGDLAKAIAAGASTVMVGSLLAGRSESPGDVVRRRGRLYKVYRGMASRSAASARLAIEGRGDALDQYVPEGEEMEFPLRGPAGEVIAELVGGLRSGMSYLDSATIEELWGKAQFVRQTEAGQRETHPGSPGE
ncbi:MAG TPA: IMP dehydrogenase [Gaiellales bacterium]|jgi:IMP dehydrogenase|nr:IMP dehydrogenase [Gaiellales bacterium]